jgi:rod shape-determining protein MreC
MNLFKRLRDTVLVVLLLALPFFFLRSSIRRPEELNAVDRTILRIAAPLQFAAAALSRGISSVVGQYVYLVDVKADNDRLVYENARLRASQRELADVQAENRRLRRLLGLRDTVQKETVSALVVAKDTTEYFRVWHLTIDAPKAEVRPNMPVISLDGAVGTVLRVAGHDADVELTVDSGFGVDVVVERTGARGFVRGSGDRSKYAVRVEYVPRSDLVEVGDLLVTSGVGCRFPKGIPVARITKVVRRDFGIYQTVEAEPSVDFSRLEEVLVVLTDSSECDQREPAPGRRPRAQR